MAKPASAMGALIKKQQEANKYIDQGQKLGTPDICPKSGMLTVPWKEESRTTGRHFFQAVLDAARSCACGLGGTAILPPPGPSINLYIKIIAQHVVQGAKQPVS